MLPGSRGGTALTRPRIQTSLAFRPQFGEEVLSMTLPRRPAPRQQHPSTLPKTKQVVTKSPSQTQPAHRRSMALYLSMISLRLDGARQNSLVLPPQTSSHKTEKILTKSCEIPPRSRPEEKDNASLRTGPASLISEIKARKDLDDTKKIELLLQAFDTPSEDPQNQFSTLPEIPEANPEDEEAEFCLGNLKTDEDLSVPKIKKPTRILTPRPIKSKPKSKVSRF